MNCNKIRYYISLFINGMLPADKKNIINQHLLLCDSCKKYAEALQRQKISLQIAVKNTELPESIPDAISLAILSTKAEKPKLRLLKNLSWNAFTRQFKIAAASAAIIALAVTAFFIFFQNNYAGGKLQNISGQIVCIGCELKKSQSSSYDCKAQGHLPVIKTSDGEYYSFNASNPQFGNLQKDEMYGCTINAIGYVYGKEHFVNIVAVNSIRR